MGTKVTNKMVNHWWRNGFYILMAVFILVIGILLYSIMDQAVTLTYLNVSMTDLENDKLILEKLIPKLTNSIDKKEIVFLLRKENPNSFIIEDDSSICIGQIKLLFKSNKLVSIKDYN